MKYWYTEATTHDGINEYLHKGVVEARTERSAEKKALELFDYDDEPLRITEVDSVLEIPKEDYEVLKRYL